MLNVWRYTHKEGARDAVEGAVILTGPSTHQFNFLMFNGNVMLVDVYFRNGNAERLFLSAQDDNTKALALEQLKFLKKEYTPLRAQVYAQTLNKPVIITNTDLNGIEDYLRRNFTIFQTR